MLLAPRRHRCCRLHFRPVRLLALCLCSGLRWDPIGRASSCTWLGPRQRASLGPHAQALLCLWLSWKKACIIGDVYAPALAGRCCSRELRMWTHFRGVGLQLPLTAADGMLPPAQSWASRLLAPAKNAVAAVLLVPSRYILGRLRCP